MDYGFEHAGRVFTPNGTAGIDPAENAARNAAIEESELAAWQAKPAEFSGYVIRGDFQTWMGIHLGRVEVTSRWKRRTRWQGYVTMEAIRVIGTNGVTYHGRYCSDNGQLCRVRRI